MYNHTVCLYSFNEIYCCDTTQSLFGKIFRLEFSIHILNRALCTEEKSAFLDFIQIFQINLWSSADNSANV